MSGRQGFLSFDKSFPLLVVLSLKLKLLSLVRIGVDERTRARVFICERSRLDLLLKRSFLLSETRQFNAFRGYLCCVQIFLKAWYFVKRRLEWRHCTVSGHRVSWHGV